MTKLKTFAAALWVCFTLNVFAIEGIQITVPSTNAVLSWPSDTSESYLIQYRHTLDATDSWQTVADQYPPDYSGTNITYFMDTNTVDYGYSIYSTNVTTGTSGPMPGGTNMITFTNGLMMFPGQGFYQVVRDGVHLAGISNDMVLTGVVKIPVELGNVYGDLITLGLSEDGDPLADSTQPAPVADPRNITINTALLANGTHYIYGSASWQDTNGGLWEADSPQYSITVSNEVSFENWMPSFGELDNTLLIRATSMHPSTDWEVDVYDSTYTYVGSFTGHTDDGDIYVAWNLEDYYGVYHTNDNFFICEVSTEYVDPPTPPTYKIADPWTGGGWAMGVQHAFDGLTDHETLYEELSGFYGAAHGSWTVRPSGSGGNPYGISFQDINEITGWDAFKDAIFNTGTRNLVYFGHGSPNGLGYNQRDTNISVCVPEIEARLHTVPAGQTNAHTFRFVFLDGCSTAKGTLPEAFGIIHKENVDSMDYYYASRRKSAFVGWTAKKSIGFQVGNTINYDHVSFIGWIQYYMLMGQTIQTAINSATTEQNYLFVTMSDLKVFGSPDVTIGSDNN